MTTMMMVMMMIAMLMIIIISRWPKFLDVSQLFNRICRGEE